MLSRSSHGVLAFSVLTMRDTATTRWQRCSKSALNETGPPTRWRAAGKHSDHLNDQVPVPCTNGLFSPGASWTGCCRPDILRFTHQNATPHDIMTGGYVLRAGPPGCQAPRPGARATGQRWAAAGGNGRRFKGRYASPEIEPAPGGRWPWPGVARAIRGRYRRRRRCRRLRDHRDRGQDPAGGRHGDGAGRRLPRQRCRVRAALPSPGGTAGHPDRWARVPGGHWLAQYEATAVKIRGAVARPHVGEEHATCGRARGRG